MLFLVLAALNLLFAFAIAAPGGSSLGGVYSVVQSSFYVFNSFLTQFQFHVNVISSPFQIYLNPISIDRGVGDMDECM